MLALLAACAAMSPAQTETNLALHKPASGSNPCNEDESPAKAFNGTVDGGLADKFCSLEDTKWLQVDLGSAVQVSRFVVKHSGSGGETSDWNTRSFKIHVSTDGKKFSQVVSVTDNTQDVTTHKVEPVTARYVQLEVLVPTQDGDNATRIYEFEVYAK